MTTRSTSISLPELLGLVKEDQLHRYIVPGGRPAPTPSTRASRVEPPAHPRAAIPPLALDEPTAYALAQQAARRGLPVEALIVEIVESWVRQAGAADKSSERTP